MAIHDAILEASGAPEGVIDGSGTDSDDPLDQAVAEIGQMADYLRGK